VPGGSAGDAGANRFKPAMRLWADGSASDENLGSRISAARNAVRSALCVALSEIADFLSPALEYPAHSYSQLLTNCSIMLCRSTFTFSRLDGTLESHHVCKHLMSVPIPAGDTVASPWMTTAEAAAYLKVKPRTLLLWVRRGKITAYLLSGFQRRVWRFLQADLDTMLAHSQNAAKEKFHAAP